VESGTADHHEVGRVFLLILIDAVASGRAVFHGIHRETDFAFAELDDGLLLSTLRI
jgi:hypothetical protein